MLSANLSEISCLSLRPLFSLLSLFHRQFCTSLPVKSCHSDVMMSSTLSQLVNQIEKLQYVVKEVISYNESCFIDPLMIQVDTYKIRRQRCYKLMTAKGDKIKLDKLQIKLDNVSKQIVTWTHSGTVFENHSKCRI